MPRKKQAKLPFLPRKDEPDVNALHRAAERGDLLFMRELVLRYKHDVNALHTEERIPPIAFAARKARLTAMKWLVEHGASVNYDLEMYPHCFSVWHYAIFFGKNLEAIIWLEKITQTDLAEHVNRCPTQERYSGATIFWYAAFTNHPELDDILEWEANEDVDGFPEQWYPGVSGLWLIAKNGRYALFQKILARNGCINPNAISFVSGISIPLILAAHDDAPIDLLWQIAYEHGIQQINATSSTHDIQPGTTPPWHIARRKIWPLVRFLLANYEELNVNAAPTSGPDQNTSLCWLAAFDKQWSLVHTMRKRGANFRAAPLHGPHKTLTIFEILIIENQFQQAEEIFNEDKAIISALRSAYLYYLLQIAIDSEQLWLIEAMLDQFKELNIMDSLTTGPKRYQSLLSFANTVFNHFSETRWRTLMIAFLTCEFWNVCALEEISKILLDFSLNNSNSSMQQATIWIVFLNIIAYGGKCFAETENEFQQRIVRLAATLTDEKKSILLQYQESFITEAKSFYLPNVYESSTNEPPTKRVREHLLMINPLFSVLTESSIKVFCTFSYCIRDQGDRELLTSSIRASFIFFPPRQKNIAPFGNPQPKRQAIATTLSPFSKPG